MRSILERTLGSALLLASASLLLGGCASMMSSAASGLADNLSSAIVNQDDPELVRAGAPSYMLLLDSFLEGDPDNPELLSAAAKLYASYGAVFADDPARAARLTAKARNYARDAMCETYAPSCAWPDSNYDEFVDSLDGVTGKQADYLYTYGFATLAYLRAHSDDWNSLAELPQVEVLFDRYLEIAGDDADAAVHTYMGVLLTLRPPSLGWKPEEAREHFEKAIAMSEGKDLSAKVEYAKGYARLLYERELHDQLLGEVIEASPYADGLTLSNVMAKEEAERLIAEADDYF
jgi:tetratricopeptide (TPR) repeat protein